MDLKKEAKKFLRDKTKNQKWDGVVHFGDWGQNEISVADLLVEFTEQRLEAVSEVETLVRRLLPVPLPEVGRPVKAVIKYSHTWKFVNHHILTHVDEDDVVWRDEDGYELSYNVDVVYWEYVNA